MFWDIMVKLILVGLVIGLGQICYIIGYSKGLTKGINTVKKEGE